METREYDDSNNTQICSVTGKEIVEGFVIGLDCIVVESEEDALKIVQDIGYKTLQESYDDENHYWTAWN